MVRASASWCGVFDNCTCALGATIFPKGTQNGQFWPKCKVGTLCKILDFGHFFGRTLLAEKIANTSRILAELRIERPHKLLWQLEVLRSVYFRDIFLKTRMCNVFVIRHEDTKSYFRFNCRCCSEEN